jgi:hypothetical protein
MNLNGDHDKIFTNLTIAPLSYWSNNDLLLKTEKILTNASNAP